MPPWPDGPGGSVFDPGPRAPRTRPQPAEVPAESRFLELAEPGLRSAPLLKKVRLHPLERALD